MVPMPPSPPPLDYRWRYRLLQPLRPMIGREKSRHQPPGGGDILPGDGGGGNGIQYSERDFQRSNATHLNDGHIDEPEPQTCISVTSRHRIFGWNAIILLLAIGLKVSAGVSTLHDRKKDDLCSTSSPGMGEVSEFRDPSEMYKPAERKGAGCTSCHRGVSSWKI